MITVTDIPESEVELVAIRASGPGGRHVNKVSSAIHLRFDVAASSLPVAVKERLLKKTDTRLSSEGVIVIKAQRFRSQEKNKADALERLDAMLRDAQKTRKKRKVTRPTKSSVKRRLDNKNKRGQRKQLRGKVDHEK